MRRKRFRAVFPVLAAGLLCLGAPYHAEEPAGTWESEVPGCLAHTLPPGPETPVPPGVSDTAEVRVLYFVPSDLEPDDVQEARILQTSKDVHRWYSDHTEPGRSVLWTHIVERVIGDQPLSYYSVEFWGRVLTELTQRGYPIWGPRKVFVIWVKGAGLWAGGAHGSHWSGNALLGGEIFIQEGCVPTHPSNWPCTPAGAMAHELGHTLGLPHPDSVGTWGGENLMEHSLMGSHWNFPERDPRSWVPSSPWGLLNYERDHLRFNPVFREQGSPYPPVPNDAMEMPDLPSPPLWLGTARVDDDETSLFWEQNGSNFYHVYGSTAPDFSTYQAVAGSPTEGNSLVHADSGETRLYFRASEIPLSSQP